MQDLLILLATSLLLPLIYGITIGGREEFFRALLRRSASGWRRSSMVRVLIRTVRHESVGLELKVLAFLGFLALATLSVAAFTKGIEMGQWAVQAASNSEEFLRQEESILAILAGVSDSVALAQDPAERALGLLQVTRENSAEATRLHEAARSYRVILFTVAAVLWAAAWWFALWWTPMRVAELRLSRMLERMTLRIQALASKNELAELAVSEDAVSDEESLKIFFGALHRICVRHQIGFMTGDVIEFLSLGASEAGSGTPSLNAERGRE